MSFLNLLLLVAILLQKAVWRAMRKHNMRPSCKSSLLWALKLVQLTTNRREYMCFTQMRFFNRWNSLPTKKK